MNYRVREYLIQLARQRTKQTVNYQKLCDDCGLKLIMSNPDHRNQIAKILEEISVFEHNHDERPLLSALVIRASDGEEGNGFYKLGEQLKFGDWKKLKREEVFQSEQINRCIDFWRVESNYMSFI